MTFRFRLATLLKLRKNERERRQLRLAEAQQADEILARRGADLESERSELTLSARAAAGPGTVNVDRLLEGGRYALVLGARREQVRMQRAQLAAEIEARRLALVEADRDVKVLEKLREKQHAAYDERERLRDVRRLDEIAQRVYLRERPA